ncbi:hypothetical protein FB446DRAFT_750740 [Lentinula raphanica]|nr:hypothetical protein FB446DRAFT_750740 [Lentinula raphanica]
MLVSPPPIPPRRRGEVLNLRWYPMHHPRHGIAHDGWQVVLIVIHIVCKFGSCPALLAVGYMIQLYSPRLAWLRGSTITSFLGGIFRFHFIRRNLVRMMILEYTVDVACAGLVSVGL